VLAGKFTVEDQEWADVSPDAKDIVKKLLTYDSDKRISALDALHHPWIKRMSTIEKVNKDVAMKTLKNLKKFRVRTNP
jgi:calcium-dependent protein kinase